MSLEQGPEDQRQIDTEARDEADREREELLARIARWLDVPMAVLAVVWAGLIVFELAVPLPLPWIEIVLGLDTLIWLVFLAEFLLEFAIAPNKLHYVRAHWLVALSVVVPFFRVVRIVRAFAALRGMSLLRILLGANRATRAAGDLFAEHRLQYVVAIDAMVVLVGAAAVFYFERDTAGANIHTFAEALWWAAALITTINVSGEPVSLEGRIIAFLLRLVALATFGYVTASIAAFLVGEDRGQRQMRAQEEEDIAEIARLREEVRCVRDALEQLQNTIDKQGR